MPLRIVQSKQNSRLKQLRRALAQPLREAGEDGRFLVGIEGPNLLGEALRAGRDLECVFVAREAERLLDDLPLSTEAPQPIAALVEPRIWAWEDLLGGRRTAAPLILVLAGIQDPGNLGTMLRSAEAFGATGVVSLPGTVNAWNPKAVRASAGSIFRVPLMAASAEECFLRLHEDDVTLWATATHHAKEANRADLTRPVALIIGNEGNGVAAEIAAQADGAITIPCPGPVESLNAAVAAGVLLYEAARQRAVSPGFHRAARSLR